MRNARVDPIQEVSAGMAAQGVQPPPPNTLKTIVGALLNLGIIGTGFIADEHIPVLSQIAQEYKLALSVVILMAEILAASQG